MIEILSSKSSISRLSGGRSVLSEVNPSIVQHLSLIALCGICVFVKILISFTPTHFVVLDLNTQEFVIHKGLLLAGSVESVRGFFSCICKCIAINGHVCCYQSVKKVVCVYVHYLRNFGCW